MREACGKGDPLGGLLDGVARRMRVARVRFDVAVAEKAADDRQALAEHERRLEQFRDHRNCLRSNRLHWIHLGEAEEGTLLS